MISSLFGPNHEMSCAHRVNVFASKAGKAVKMRPLHLELVVAIGCGTGEMRGIESFNPLKERVPGSQ